MGLISLLAALIATLDSRLAARINLWITPAAPVFALVFAAWFSSGLSAIEFSALLLDIAAFSGAIVIPGFFWRAAARRDWPAPLANTTFARRPGLALASGTGVLCLLVVLAFFWSLSRPWWPPVSDCGYGPLLDEQGLPRNIDFTARIVLVGPRTFRGYSLWSIARVEERYAGVQYRVPGFIILQAFFRPGDRWKEYFVEGQPSYAVLARFLPVIVRAECGRTGPRDWSAVEIRILKDGPLQSGTRLIGRVYQGPRWKGDLPSVPGTEIYVESAAGRIVLTTDAEGIYDAIGLPPGRYTVRAVVQDAQTFNDPETAVADLKLGETRVENIYVRERSAPSLP